MSMEPGYYGASPGDSLRWAWQRRPETDYEFSFWTSLGWTVLSCGLFSYYVVYQLTRRMRDHNLRRLELLDAANTLAWERTVATGRDEELRGRFERVAGALAALRQLAGEFRDPGLWVVIVALSGGIGLIVLYWLLDTDLVKHGSAEAAVEGELAAIYEALGVSIAGLAPAEPKNPHQYGLRIVAVLASCGFYSYWWLSDLMEEGNRHFQRDWAWEDRFVELSGAA